MRFLGFLFILGCICSELSFGQTTSISGRVVDASTGEAIPGVNVYIAGTTIGASTTPDGEFSFTIELIGKQEIVSSFIGYKTQSKSIDLGTRSPLSFDFSLEIKVQELNEIRVTASNNEFLKQLDEFKTFFLGFDTYSSQTIIQNPEVLDFSWNERRKTYSVSASAPLTIFNNALGYIYEIELKEARFNPNDNTGFYKVYPRVIEMEPPNRGTQRRWNRNRSESYKGSSRHFFSSLASDRIRRNKFTIYPRKDIFLNYSDSVNHMQRWFSSNWEFIQSNYEVYIIDSETFRIGYDLGQITPQNQIAIQSKLSAFTISGFPEILVINNAGLHYQSSLINYLGKWNNDRFSRFLPLDYSD